MPCDTWRAYCKCGAAVTALSSNGDLARMVIDQFWLLHLGDGHGLATRAQAAHARRTEREAERRAVTP